jgi:hypothetical protein
VITVSANVVVVFSGADLGTGESSIKARASARGEKVGWCSIS